MHKFLMSIWACLLIAFPLVVLIWGDGAGVIEDIPVAGIVMGAIASLYFMSHHKRLLIVVATGFFTALFLLFFYLLGPLYDSGKFSLFLMIYTIFGVLLGLCFQEQRFLERLPGAFLIVGGIATLLLISAPSAYQADRLSFSNANPIWMARTVGMAGLAAVYFIIRGHKWAWAVLIVSTFAMYATGSRGPLVSVAVALGYGLIFRNSSKGKYHNLLKIGFVLSLVVVSHLNFGFIPQGRVFDFSVDSGRTAIYSYAFDLIADNPAGIGVGYFSIGPIKYPHNIFLEFLVEWGWFLGGALVAVICWGGFRLLRMPTKYDILKLAFVAELLNSQFSGDITTPRVLYALVFVGLCYRPKAVRVHHSTPTTPS